MEQKENQPCRKKEHEKVAYSVRLKIIDEISNGQLSANYASKKYNIPRGTINYWIKKMLSFEQKEKMMSSKKELEQLKKRIEELELIKSFQQEIIAEMEIETGKDTVKKSLPGSLQKEIEKRKASLLKENSCMNASGSVNKRTTND